MIGIIGFDDPMWDKREQISNYVSRKYGKENLPGVLAFMYDEELSEDKAEW